MTKKLNFKQLGKGKDIILIHGLFGRLDNLNMVAKVLAKNYRVTSIDVRNHGNSFHDDVMDYPTMAEDVRTLMQHLAIDKAIVLGHSMGGKIAMELALSSPKLVEKLIVADIAPVVYQSHHTEIIKGLKSINLTTMNKRSDADNELAEYVDDAGVRGFLLRNLTQEDGKFSFTCNITSIEKNYPNIINSYQGSNSYNGSTLFIKGENSDYILPEHKNEILRLFPHSRAHIIQGAGHWLHAEKPAAFNRCVERFLMAD